VVFCRSEAVVRRHLPSLGRLAWPAGSLWIT
jgi:hypothetical protein